MYIYIYLVIDYKTKHRAFGKVNRKGSQKLFTLTIALMGSVDLMIGIFIILNNVKHTLLKERETY